MYQKEKKKKEKWLYLLLDITLLILQFMKFDVKDYPKNKN